MSDIGFNIFVLLNRYLHIVATTLLVGGTLFYEMVVPVAIDELKAQQQLSVFARARWLFRWIVWGAAAVLLITGIISSYRNLHYYLRADILIPRVPYAPAPADQLAQSVWMRAGWWWAAHATAGVITVAIALFLTISRRPPSRPIGWMRLNLVLLLVVIFLGSATRNVRRLIEQQQPSPFINAFAPD